MSFLLPVINLKGGVSKTTTSMLVAGALEQLLPGQVVVVDSDKQGSASLWAGKGRFPVPVVAAPADASALAALVAELSEKYTAIIVDCPPSADAPITRAALAHADLVVVPCPPAPLDVDATTMLMAVLATQFPQLRTVVVPAMVPTVATDVSTAMLNRMMATWPVAKSRLHRRTAYEQASAFGTKLLDTKHRTAARAQQEVDSLTSEILLTLSTGAK